MFYSSTFLARKLPLGTVWRAAHLQRKLRKSDYISTNVPSTVDRILFPEVQIALRMSGHLLLGIVRIYSKQVEYLYNDFKKIKTTINKVHNNVNVNLPQDALNAPWHSVTLHDPDGLNLDEYYKNLGEDSHLKSLDEITLSDPYDIISFDRDLRGSSLTEDNSETWAAPMDEDVHPQAELNTPPLNYPSSSNLVNSNVGIITPQNLPSVETMLHASTILPDRAAPDRVLEEQINEDNENPTLPMQEIVMSPDGHFPSPHGHEEHQPEHQHLNSPSPFDHPMSEMVIPQSPPNAEQQKVQFQFDGRVVLSNRRMKRWLNDTSSITRKRGNCLSSSLDVRGENKRLRPYINGACPALEAIHSDGIIKSKKFQLAPNQEVHPEANQEAHQVANQEAHQVANQEAHLEANQEAHQERNVAQSPKDSDKEIEYLRNEEYAQSPTGAGSSGYHDSGMETPVTFYDRSSQGEHTALSVIPELDSSAGDLEFLEQDVNSAAGPDGTPELRALSSQTRAAAQYLKRQSSVTPISENAEDSSEVLSLNKILEGKHRKICARMFYETLVLKSHGLINVRQETPYGDIALKVTSKLLKGKFVE